jgi:WD40 repeat protein
VRSVAFSPDGATIVSGSDDRTIKVWDAGSLTHHIPHPCSPKLSTPTLATASLELKAEKQSAHSNWVRSVAFSPDGKTIVSGSDDQTIKVWDAGVSTLTPLNA